MERGRDEAETARRSRTPTRTIAWGHFVTERAAATGVTGAPTVLVAGEEVQPDPGRLPPRWPARPIGR